MKLTLLKEFESQQRLKARFKYTATLL